MVGHCIGLRTVSVGINCWLSGQYTGRRILGLESFWTAPERLVFVALARCCFSCGLDHISGIGRQQTASRNIIKRFEVIQLVLGCAAWAALAGFCGWRGAVNWRRFRRSRGKPILEGITEAQVRGAAAEWPLRETRWPPPNPEGSDAMQPWLASAYARLADRMHFSLLIAAEVLVVVGGSWLGITLPGIWADIRRSGNANAASQSGTAVFPWSVVGIQGFLHLLPVVLIMVAMLLLVTARQYSAMNTAYREVANSNLAAAAPPVTQVTTQAHGVARLLRWLHR